MGNARNGMDQSAVPQGLVGQMMPLPFDGSGVTAAPIDNQRPGLSTTLASALASATPENQRLVCNHLLIHLLIFANMPKKDNS